MNNIERKSQGLPYRYDDPELLGDQHIYQNKMTEYNRTLPTETELRQKLLREVFPTPLQTFLNIFLFEIGGLPEINVM